MAEDFYLFKLLNMVEATAFIVTHRFKTQQCLLNKAFNQQRDDTHMMSMEIVQF